MSIPERSPTNITIQFIWIFTVLCPLMFHSATIRSKDCAALPSTCMWFYSCMTVKMPFHMTMDKKPFPTNITCIPHVA